MANGFAIVERGGQIVALLSRHYQLSDFCSKEAYYPLVDDPFNRKRRLSCFGSTNAPRPAG